MTTTEMPPAFAVRWRELSRWDPSSFHAISWHWPDTVLKPIGSVLRMRKERVDRQVFSFQSLRPITIHFDGSISPRVVEGRAYTMDLWFARPGDLVVAKIDLKNGAVAIVPEGWSNVAVTGHFAVYEPDLTQVVPEYLHRVIQTSFFKAHLWRNKVGAEGRKEVKLDFFEAERIPLPPLQIQRAIVGRWHAAQQRSAISRQRIEELDAAHRQEFSKVIGNFSENNGPHTRVFAVRWRDVERWGVQICRRRTKPLRSNVFPITTIGAICHVGSGGTPSRSRAEYFGGAIPWVKTTEVRNQLITETEETLTEAGLRNSSAKIYPPGSIIIAMYGQGATRGRTGKLGVEAATNQACAVLTNFDQQVDPDFVWYYLMGEYSRLRELASGNNQPNLNAEMIACYPIPLPPLEVQKSLVERAHAVQVEIAQSRMEADHLAREAQREVEETILGIRTISAS